MEYEYDYDPVKNEDSNPSVAPIEEEIYPNVTSVEAKGDSYYYERANVQPEFSSAKYEDNQEADDDKRANRLCMWSLACALVPDFLLSTLAVAVSVSADSPGLIGGLLSMLSGVGHIASLVLMIYVRVKYPKNVFGKVLMWLYIIGIVLTIVGIILVMAFFFWLCHGLQSSGCSGMLYVLPALLGGI